MTCERPWAFWFLLLLIPATANLAFRLRSLAKLTGKPGLAAGHDRAALYRNVKIRMIARAICWMTALALLTAALSGLAWGDSAAPVQRGGAAVSLVFDISWSMTAPDAGSTGAPLTRLQAASQYAQALLSRLDHIPVSLVIAKGAGTTLVPLTEDRNALLPVLDALSPQLLSAPGTDLGQGIDAAMRSFPAASGTAPAIILFTDGEETTGSLAEAAGKAAQYGIPVFLLGFGSPGETEILIGDGQTPVRTALREDILRAAAASVKTGAGLRTQRVTYLEAAAPGSAAAILNALTRHAAQGVVFESRPVPRYRLSIFLALLFFAAGLALHDLRLKRPVPSLAGSALPVLLALVTLAPALQSCDASLGGRAAVLQSAWHWGRENYQDAVAGFLSVADRAVQTEDHALLQYALYGLAATYMTQGEYDAAHDRLKSIAPDAPRGIRFAALYDLGIIAYQKGDFEGAALFFRQALELDNTSRASVNAKVNLELTGARITALTSPAEQELIPAATQDSQQAAKNALFSIIREQEQNRWKNSQTSAKPSGGLDY
jgi:Ca-activated chloride channel family protein